MEYLSDDERVDDLKKWWKENGKSVLFGVALGLGLLFGWRWWGNYQENRALQASALYSQVMVAAQGGKVEEVEAVSNRLRGDYGNTAYAVFSALSLAKMQVEKGELAKAREHLQWAYDHANAEETKHLSRIRLARVLYALGEQDAAMALIDKVEGGAFQVLYAELKGDIYRAKGDLEQARKAYEEATLARAGMTGYNPSLQYKLEDVTPPPASE